MSALDIIRKNVESYESELKDGGYAREKLRNTQESLEEAEREYEAAKVYFEEIKTARDEWKTVLAVVEEYGYLGDEKQEDEPVEAEEAHDEGLLLGATLPATCRCFDCVFAGVEEVQY